MNESKEFFYSYIYTALQEKAGRSVSLSFQLLLQSKFLSKSLTESVNALV